MPRRLPRARPAAMRRFSSVPARSSSSAPRRSVTSRFTRCRSARSPSSMTTPVASSGRSRTRAEAVGATLVAMRGVDLVLVLHGISLLRSSTVAGGCSRSRLRPRRTAVAARARSFATENRPVPLAQGQWDKRYRAAAPSPSGWSRSGPVPCSARPAQIATRTSRPGSLSTPPGRSSGTSRPGRACVDARTGSG